MGIAAAKKAQRLSPFYCFLYHSLSWLWGSWWLFIDYAQKIPLGKAPLTEWLQLWLRGAGNMLPDRNCPYAKPCFCSWGKAANLGCRVPTPINPLQGRELHAFPSLIVFITQLYHAASPNWFCIPGWNWCPQPQRRETFWKCHCICTLGHEFGVHVPVLSILIAAQHPLAGPRWLAGGGLVFWVCFLSLIFCECSWISA